MPKVLPKVLITGGSRGIGLEIVKLLSTKGYDVTNLSRTPSNVNGVHDVACDLTKDEDLINSIDKIKDIDVLICNAGFGISGAIEFQDINEIKKQFELNFFSQTKLVKLAIPFLKKSKGKIIFTSSLASEFAIPFQSFYSASKAALEDYAMALSNELKMFNIQVCFVRLGDVQTSFTQKREKNIIGDDVYGGRIEKSVHKMELDEQKGMKPEKVAKAYFKIIKKKKIKIKYTVGIGNKLLSFLRKILPLNLVNKLVGKLYIKK